MDNLSVKIKLPSGAAVERQDETAEKRMKANSEYTDVGWRVLGVPFGGPIKGRDLDGEAFHETTDIWLKIGDTVPVTYYHGFGPDKPEDRQNPPVIIGQATYTGADKRGHWFDLALDIDEDLAERVMLAGPMQVKASTGAVPHLVRMGVGGLIDVWPVGELALFDVNDWRLPANDFAVIEAKSETITEAIPEASEGAVDAVDAPEDVKTKTTIPTEGITTMTDEILTPDQDTPEQETIDIAAEIKAAIEAEREGLKKSVLDELKAAKAEPGTVKGQFVVKAPEVIKSLGEKDEMKAFMAYVKTGQENRVMKSLKASNPTDMNIGTAADGQYLVPTPHYQNVITRRDESALWQKLGVTEIPGIGTTVNVPYDNEADGEFVVTTETAEFDDDAPATERKQLTLAKYSKIIRISHELLRDEDSRLEAFLANWVGRGMAKTHNDLLITEVESYGTSLKTFASATAVAVGELEDMVFGSDMVSYLDGGSANWVMSGPSYSKIISLTGSDRSYAQSPQGQFREQILGFPVHFTNKADTIGASKKSVFFGDWSQVGVRNGQGLQMIRDPYTRARYGQIELVYLFDCVYGVLNSEAIGYGVHPTG
jgi:HK97 family phage major capsid protein